MFLQQVFGNLVALSWMPILFSRRCAGISSDPGKRNGSQRTSSYNLKMQTIEEASSMSVPLHARKKRRALMRHELMTQPFVSTCYLLDSLPSSESAQGSLKTKTQLSPGRLLEGYVRLQLFPNTWVMPNCLWLVLWWSWKIFLLVLLDRTFQSPSLSHGPKANHPLPSIVEARTCKVLKGVEKFSLEISQHKLSPLIWPASSYGCCF